MIRTDSLHPIGRHRANRLPDSDSRTECIGEPDPMWPNGGACLVFDDKTCPRCWPSLYVTEASHRARCVHPLHRARRHPLTDSCISDTRRVISVPLPRIMYDAAVAYDERSDPSERAR